MISGAVCFGDWANPGTQGSDGDAAPVTEEIHELERWRIRYQRSKRNEIEIIIMKILGRMVLGVGSGLKEEQVHLLG